MSDVNALLLVVVGEPLTEDQTETISDRVIEGLTAWDRDKCGVDLDTELLNFVNKNVEAETPETGGTILRADAPQIGIEFLIAPTVTTLQLSVQNFLTRSAPYKHIVHAGPTVSGPGSWILRDGTFSFHDFARMLHRQDIATALTMIASNSTISVSCFPEGEWTDQGVKHHGLNKYGHISVGVMGGRTNVDASCASIICRYVGGHLQYTPLKALLPRANLVGSIRFRHPTIYVFPAGQGDAALFGVDGFLMVLDGGFQRKTCFWDFLSHVDHLDALVISGLNGNNVFGISSFLDLLSTVGCAPKVGHAFGNIPDIGKSPNNQEKNPLLLSLYQEGAKIYDRLARLGLKPQTCAYVPPLVTAKYPESITLYEKVGQGRLEMYVLNPLKESKEYAEFVDTWKRRALKFIGYKYTTKPGSETGDFSIPLINRTSMAVLIVWRPANPNERIVRILYPGSCPQEKVLNGLEKLKTLDFLKYPYCNGSLLEKKLLSVAAGMTAVLLSKKPSTGKTAAEVLAEGAKANSVVSKPFELRKPSIPNMGHRRDTPTASPPSSTPTQMPSQSTSQLLSPRGDSDADTGNMEDDNGEEGSGITGTHHEQTLDEDDEDLDEAGDNVGAETRKSCAYEAVECGTVSSSQSTNIHQSGDDRGRDGISPQENTEEVFDRHSEKEVNQPTLLHSSLNPNAPPFYPRSSQSSSAGSSPDSIRKLDHLKGNNPIPCTGPANEYKREKFDDGKEIGPNGDRSNVTDLRTKWGEPLGLPTLPNKKPPTRTSSKTNGSVEPGAVKTNPVGPSKTTTAKPPLKSVQSSAGKTDNKPASVKLSSRSASLKNSATTAAGPNAKVNSKTTAERKLSTTTGKAPPLRKLTPTFAPCYVDLAYIPHHGNPYYCNVDFFKCVRSKYYVLSSVNPPKETLDALLLGKKSWNCPEESVVLIPTYDSDTLSFWMGIHKDDMAMENIDVSPACSRCSVNLEEPAGATCAAYRLEL